MMQLLSLGDDSQRREVRVWTVANLGTGRPETRGAATWSRMAPKLLKTL